MGEITRIDKLGRITIPVNLQEKYGIKPGDKLEIRDEEGKIVIGPVKTGLKKVRANRKWGKEAFLKTGESTFAE